MATPTINSTRERALSHKQYLETLHRPTLDEWRRISEYQKRKEVEIDSKYHTAEAYNAATTIQKAYRGHRARRELQGFALDPSSRWVELLRELRFREATAVHHGTASPGLIVERRQRAPSDVAKLNWHRVGHIAEHAVGGAARPSSRQSHDYLNAKEIKDETEEPQEPAESLLMDSRYFLEMVDEKHRYGANLQVYHEEWLRSTTGENFFYWLDHGEGRHLDLPGCRRVQLEKESIRYLSREERSAYLVDVDDQGRLRWHKNDELITTSVERYKDSILGVVAKDAIDAPDFNDEEIARQRTEDQHAFSELLQTRSDGSQSDSSSDSLDLSQVMDHEQTAGQEMKPNRARTRHRVSPATILNHLLRASIKPGTWIYVADTTGRLYVGIKTSGAFQHASFLSGARISSAGSIGIENGRLTYLAPLSGHYRPTTKSFKVFINNLQNQGVDFSQTRVSHAFEILQSMEVYSRSKKGLKKALKGKRAAEDRHQQSPELADKFHLKMDEVTATDLIDEHWEREHRRRGLSRLIGDLSLRKRSLDISNDRS